MGNQRLELQPTNNNQQQYILVCAQKIKSSFLTHVQSQNKTPTSPKLLCE
jgi:hypothetical protein